MTAKLRKNRSAKNLAWVRSHLSRRKVLASLRKARAVLAKTR